MENHTKPKSSKAKWATKAELKALAIGLLGIIAIQFVLHSCHKMLGGKFEHDDMIQYPARRE
jgi:hypothetical protein